MFQFISKASLLIMIMLCLSSCTKDKRHIRVIDDKITFEGKEITIEELTTKLSSITQAGDTPYIKLTVHPDATMGDVNEIKTALRKASLLKVKYFTK